MKSFCLLLALAAAAHSGIPPVTDAVLFDRGLTFAQFLARTAAQRKTWRAIALRTDIATAF